MAHIVVLADPVLESKEDPRDTLDGGGEGGAVCSIQSPAPVEGVSLVGCGPVQVEPTYELSAQTELALSSPHLTSSPSSVTADTDFCDSFLNPIPDVCKSQACDSTPDSVLLCGDCHMDRILPDFDSLDSFDLESVLSTPVPSLVN